MLNPGARLPTAVVSVLAAATMALTPSYAADPTWKMQSAFSLTVGQTAIVYAVRGKECTDEAPSYDSIRGQLPSTTLGSFTDGGTVQRESGRCALPNARAGQGGWVKARAIAFTASKTGYEILGFYSDRVAVTVK